MPTGFSVGEYATHLVICLFLLINFDLTIGTIYGFMAIFDFVLSYVAYDMGLTSLIPEEKNKKDGYINIVWGFALYIGVAFIGGFVAVWVNPSATFGGSLVKTFSSTPILYGSSFLKLMVWGILIPVLETKFFFKTLLAYGLYSAKTGFPSAFSTNGIIAAVFFGAVFSLFHLLAKGITDNAALAVTFVFGFLSIMMVLYFREAVQAIMGHIITNSISMMQSLGLGFYAAVPDITMGVVYVLAVFVISWFMLFQQIPILNILPKRLGL